MPDKAGKLILDLLRVQSDQLLVPIILELILVYSCARILHSTVSLARLGLDTFVRIHMVSMLESTKKDKMF